MRLVGTIPHPKIQITVFYMNEKMVVKFEAAGMEQVVKFTNMETPDLESVSNLVDEAFMSGVIDRFNQMFLELQRIKNKP